MFSQVQSDAANLKMKISYHRWIWFSCFYWLLLNYKGKWGHREIRIPNRLIIKGICLPAYFISSHVYSNMAQLTALLFNRHKVITVRKQICLTTYVTETNIYVYNMYIHTYIHMSIYLLKEIRSFFVVHFGLNS